MAYKDSLFRSLFANEKAALALYNALHGTNYRAQDTDIRINTLDESLFTPQKNDLSFLLNGKLVVLVEHQSSINENMPFRFLHPVLRLLEHSIDDKKAIYRKALVKLPRPQFIVLYNGTEPFPNEKTLRLSGAFEKVESVEDIYLELAVRVYNINEGRNTEMANRCEELRGYAYFVERVRCHESAERKRDPALDKAVITRVAIKKAIQDCKDRSLLMDFWDKLSAEEISMLGSEWDINIAMEVEREESFEKGREEGREESLEKVARNMLRKGFSFEEIAELSGLDIERVRELS